MKDFLKNDLALKYNNEGKSYGTRFERFSKKYRNPGIQIFFLADELHRLNSSFEQQQERGRERENRKRERKDRKERRRRRI